MGNKMIAHPGPFACGSRRPSRNTTARSYSLRILILENSQKAITTTMTITPVMEHPPRIAASSGNLLHFEHQVVHADDANLRFLLDRPGVQGLPIFDFHEQEFLRI